jgi:hypothetical protein
MKVCFWFILFFSPVGMGYAASEMLVSDDIQWCNKLLLSSASLVGWLEAIRETYRIMCRPGDNN